MKRGRPSLSDEERLRRKTERIKRYNDTHKAQHHQYLSRPKLEGTVNIREAV